MFVIFCSRLNMATFFCSVPITEFIYKALIYRKNQHLTLTGYELFKR